MRPIRKRLLERPPNFNPRTHVGCDVGHRATPSGISISIHAPTWGATDGKIPNRSMLDISIHAPTWGATLPLGATESRKQFQSTHPRGVRLINSSLTEESSLFQSTHPRGVRPEADNKRADTKLFQSTHPRGVRPHTVVKVFANSNFNPRTHVGCDCRKLTGHCTIEISIHAPTWGAT